MVEEIKKAKISNYLEDYFLVEKEKQELEIKLDKCGTELVNAESIVSYLEKENQQLKQQLEELEESYNNTMRYLNKTRSELLNLPNKIVEEIKENNIYLNSSKPNQKDHIYDSYLIEAKTLDTILKKYGGENESSNDKH